MNTLSYDVVEAFLTDRVIQHEANLAEEAEKPISEQDKKYIEELEVCMTELEIIRSKIALLQ